MFTIWRVMVVCGVLLCGVGSMTGCSLLLDTTECVRDDDCAGFIVSAQSATCVENICVVTNGQAPECTMNAQCGAGRFCEAARCVTAPMPDMPQTDMSVPDMAPTDMARDGGTTQDMSPDLGVPDMEPADMGPMQVLVDGAISGSVMWRPENVYTLRGLVTVENQAVLTILPGTTILGEQGSALIVRRGGKLIASGTQDAPIVFTSSKPAGERKPGDWGGVAMLGNAPVNESNPSLEGVPIALPYGGTVAEGNCGLLRYVRIEFAGFELSPGKELNGLTLAGCGSDTLIQYVQVHYGQDDGVEIFGGTVGIRHVVISRAQDDSLDVDKGWQGKGQFIMILQDQPGDGHFAIEASNSSTSNAMPRTSPELYNVTMVAPDGNGTGGIVFKEGVGGLYSHMLMVSHDLYAISVSGEETAGLTTQMPPELVVKDSIFFDIGAGGMGYWPTTSDEFDEGAYFADPMWRNVLGRDPQLGNPYDLQGPDFTTSTPSALGGAGAPLDTGGEGFIDVRATYYGAFNPGGSDWTMGWTSFPPN